MEHPDETGDEALRFLCAFRALEWRCNQPFYVDYSDYIVYRINTNSQPAAAEAPRGRDYNALQLFAIIGSLLLLLFNGCGALIW